MPKSNLPTEALHPEKGDDNVVAIRNSVDALSDADTNNAPAECSNSTVDSASVTSGPSDTICFETSERWATAILSLMHVERSRFQEHPENLPRVHIASLAAMGGPQTLTMTGSAHSSITLRKPRLAQTDPAQEASKIHPFQGLKRPKS
jgi:hypothetical protein